VTDALNTRFDIFDSNQSCPTGGSCSPSINSTKDVVRDANASGCKLDKKGWKEVSSPYLPSDPINPITTTPEAMGYPRDMCHAVSLAGSCANGRIGNGNWDRDAYFRTNYIRAGVGTRWTSADWQGNTGLPANATRYQVYQWETDHRGQTIDGKTVLGSRAASGSGASAPTSYGSPQCGTGQVPDATTPDRRRISVAVVNCNANNVHGNSTDVPVEKWIEVFLVEPSIKRTKTDQGDVYVEVIGETIAGGSGATAGQVIRHDVPYLIK
jgi:hypothetical protein